MTSEFDKRRREGASLRRSMLLKPLQHPPEPSPQQTSSDRLEGLDGVGGNFSSRELMRGNSRTQSASADIDVTATLHQLFQRELGRLDELSRARPLDRHELRALESLVKAYSNFRRQSLPDNDESLSELSDDELKALLEDPSNIK